MSPSRPPSPGSRKRRLALLALGALAIFGLLLPPVHAEARRTRRPRRVAERSLRTGGTEGYWGVELFLVQDKVMPGLTLDVQGDTFGAGAEFGLMWSTSDERDEVIAGSFLGGVLGFHAYARLVRGPCMDLRFGTGLDAFGLWAINSEEWQLGMPMIAELRAFLSPRWQVFAQARLYAIKSEGLGAGEDLDGRVDIPLLLVVGLGGWS